MSVTEKEEKVEVSEARIEEIKKEDDREEDSNLRLSDLVMELDRESVNAADKSKNEQDYLHEDWNDQQIQIEENAEDLHMSTKQEERDASYSQYNNIKKALINEDLEESNSAKAAGFEVETNGREKKRKDMDESLAQTSKRSRRITESHEAKTTKEEAKEYDEPCSALDPTEITEEIVLEYHDFVDYIFQMLKDGEKEEELQKQMWADILNRGKQLVETLNQKMKRVAHEMKRMKEDENLKEEYAVREMHIPLIFTYLQTINSVLESSPNIAVVSDINCREKVLPYCLDELKQWKKQLAEMILLIRDLKNIQELTEKQKGEN